MMELGETVERQLKLHHNLTPDKSNRFSSKSYENLVN
jgi:hypothetical protein